MSWMSWLYDDDYQTPPKPPKPRRSRRGNREPGSIRTLAYTWSYIRFNFFTFLLNVLTIGIAGVSILAFGYLAYVSYLEAESKLDTNQAKKITATCVAGEADESKRFNAQQIAAIKELPWVDMAFELVSQNVYLSVGGVDPKFSVMEGTIPHDPEIDPVLMERGGGVSSDNAQEIILTAPLLAELTHSSSSQSGSNSTLYPKTIQLTVRRTTTGGEENFNREYQLVGVLNSQTKKAFIPLQQAKYLEMWGGNKIDEVPGMGGKTVQADIEVDAGRLYVAKTVSRDDLEQARKYFQIDLKEIFSLSEPIKGERGEMRIVRQDNRIITGEEIAKLTASLPKDIDVFPGYQIKTRFQIGQREAKGALLRAYSSKDPRLGDIKAMDERPVGESISSPFTAILSKDFANQYFSASPITEHDLLIELGSSTAKLEIVGATVGFIGDMPFDALCSLDTLSRLNQEVKLKKFCLVVMNLATAKRLKNGEYGTEDGKKGRSFPVMEYKGIGNWDVACALTVMPGDKDSVSEFFKDRLKDSAVEVFELSVAEGLKVSNEAKTKQAEIAFCSIEEIDHSKLPWASLGSFYLKDGCGLASVDGFSSDYSINIGGDKFRLGSMDKIFPSAYILFAKKQMPIVLASLKKQGSNAGGEMFCNFLDLIIKNPVAYNQVKATLEKQDIAVQEVRVPKYHETTGYEFHSQKPKTKINRQLLTSLKADRTFLDVYPTIEVRSGISGLPAGNKFSFLGSSAEDRLKLKVPVKLGSWLKGESLNEVVLPAKVFASSGKDPASSIGKNVTLTFERQIKRSYAEPTLDIECLIDGVIDGESGFLPLALVKNVYLWQAGRLPYNERTGAFINSENLYDQSGRESCKIYVKSMADVRPAVDYLRQNLGYNTEDHLKDQQRVSDLGRILIFLVVMIVIGSVVSGVLNVVITTLMSTKTRFYEIGILRAHGASNQLIKRIFFQLGLIMGLISFAVAFAVTPVAIQLIVFSIKEAFSVELGKMMLVPFIDPKCWWLYLIGLATTVFFCCFGVYWSAVLACRTSIVKALISRE